MKRSTEIQILGTPSTKFTYINHILKQVIERASISVDYKEITDVKELLKLQIEAIPMVRVNGRAFDFSNRIPTNEKLKELILYLLDKEEFGNWPLISLVTKNRLPNSTYMLSRKLSNSWNAVIDWYSTDKENESNTESASKEKLDSLIRSITKDWRGQLFSSPLTRYFNTGDPVPSFEEHNALTHSTLIIIDDQVSLPSSFIRQAVFKYQIPVILLNGSDHPLAWKSILLFQDNDNDACNCPILSLLDGNLPSSNNPSMGITTLKINDPAFDRILTCVLKRNELTNTDAAFAFHMSNEQQLDKVLQNQSIPIKSRPNIFLPSSASNSNKLIRFLNAGLASTK